MNNYTITLSTVEWGSIMIALDRFSESVKERENDKELAADDAAYLKALSEFIGGEIKIQRESKETA